MGRHVPSMRIMHAGMRMTGSLIGLGNEQAGRGPCKRSKGTPQPTCAGSEHLGRSACGAGLLTHGDSSGVPYPPHITPYGSDLRRPLPTTRTPPSGVLGPARRHLTYMHLTYTLLYESARPHVTP